MELSTAFILWLLAGAGAAVLLWAIGCYNRLVELRNRVNNAFGQIDVQLRRRHDLIPNLVEVAKRYMQHEQETLQAVIAARSTAQGAAGKARNAPTDASAIAALAVAEQSLMSQVGRLLAVAEAYPELKADQIMRDLSEQLASTESHVGFSRQAYNDAVLDLNNKAQAFPDLIIARLTGFAPGAMLESTSNAAERAAPKVGF